MVRSESWLLAVTFIKHGGFALSIKPLQCMKSFGNFDDLQLRPLFIDGTRRQHVLAKIEATFRESRVDVLLWESFLHTSKH